MTRRAHRSRAWRGPALAIALAGGLAGPALAQNAADEAARAARQFQSQQAEQERLRQLEQQQRANRAPAGDVPAPPQPESAAKDERCFNIGTITVGGVHLVPEADVRATVAPWEGKCLGLTEINNVLKALTFLYVKRGYVAARAYLQEQDLSQGKLSIAMVEGKLEGIHLNGQGDDHDRVIASAFPGMTGRPVNLRDVEQGLDQINRLHSNSATIAMAAGSQPGDTVLEVTNKPDNRVRVTLGADNLGATVSGIYQSRINVALDNVLGSNDAWQFGYQRSNSRNPLFMSSERPNSDTINASVSVPYGYWTFGLDSLWSHYHSSVPGQDSIINTSGGSQLISPYLSWVFHRDQVSKTSLTGRLTRKDTVNDILGSRIDVASRTLTIAALELNHSRQLWGGQASASFGYQRGLPIFGAFDDASAAAGTPKSEFSKFTTSLSYTRPFSGGTVTPIFSTYVLGQWTPDRLFGTEQMSFGGWASVRGVQDSILFADKGALARTELSLLLPASEQPTAAKLIGRVEPYVALDVGHAAAFTDTTATGNSSNGGTVVGAVLGLRNRAGRFTFDISYARLISEPTLPAAGSQSRSLVQVGLTIGF